eukprot:s1637_g8.t1
MGVVNIMKQSAERLATVEMSRELHARMQEWAEPPTRKRRRAEEEDGSAAAEGPMAFEEWAARPAKIPKMARAEEGGGGKTPEPEILAEDECHKALRAEWAFESVTARVLHLNSRAQQVFFRCSGRSSEQGQGLGFDIHDEPAPEPTMSMLSMTVKMTRRAKHAPEPPVEQIIVKPYEPRLSQDSAAFPNSNLKKFRDPAPNRTTGAESLRAVAPRAAAERKAAETEVKKMPPEPYPEIKLEHTVAGAEKAKEEGNRLFAAGSIEESARWFSKAIWLVEESGYVTGVTATLHAILHSNRAFARLKMRQWTDAEVDCSQALTFNSSNPKALYRRAMARKELQKYDAALADVEALLPMLDQAPSKDALDLREELLRLTAPSKEVPKAEKVDPEPLRSAASFAPCELREVNWCPDDDTISVSEILGTSTTKDEEDQKERDEAVRESKLVTPEPSRENSFAKDLVPQGVRQSLTSMSESLRERQQKVQSSQHEWWTYQFAIWVSRVVFLLFALASAVLLVFWARHINEEAYVVTFFVMAIAALAYLAKISGMGEIKLGGRKLPIIRYIDWITTTPLMLFELCVVGGAEKHTAILVIGCDLLMLTGGIVSAMIEKSLQRNLWFGISVFFFVIMVTALQVDVANGTVLERPPDVQQLFSYLKWLTIISWSGYPVVVLLGRAHFGLISKGMEDALLCILDCISKIGMEFFVAAPKEPAQKPPSPAGAASRAPAPAALASLPAASPKSSMEMLRQLKSLKRNPTVMTQYVSERVPPALLQSLFSKSPIEADDLALVLQCLRTAAAADTPMPPATVGEYLQQLLRTNAAETQFSMLSTSEKQIVRELITLAPSGDQLIRGSAQRCKQRQQQHAWVKSYGCAGKGRPSHSRSLF